MKNNAAERIVETTTEQSLSAEEKQFLQRMRDRVKKVVPLFPALMIVV
jgi:hypothetical protein